MPAHRAPHRLRGAGCRARETSALRGSRRPENSSSSRSPARRLPRHQRTTSCSSSRGAPKPSGSRRQNQGQTPFNSRAIIAPCPAPPEPDYREKALKILPWICTRCAREFPASRLRELTVPPHRRQPRPQPARRLELGAAVHLLPRERARRASRIPAPGAARRRCARKQKAPGDALAPLADLGKKLRGS